MNRRLETKRLGIYLVLSFSMTWIIFFAFILTGFRWNGENPEMESFVAIGMLVPVAAHVLTRWMTKEGFALTGKGSMMLGINLKDGKWIYYVFAMLVPWLYYELGHALIFFVKPEIFDPEYYKVFGIEKEMAVLFPINSIISGSLVSFAAFGEEGGWRAYMMPKLTELLGTKKAILAGGVLWGLWHAPLTCVGHNFGTDYPGFPYLGILLMCIYATFLGILLTFVTVRSGSVWPAAILHGVNNANPSMLALFFNTERAEAFFQNPVLQWICQMVPVIIIGSICLVLMCKTEKTVSKEQIATS